MREILFRGKYIGNGPQSKYYGIWLYGDLGHWKDSPTIDNRFVDASSIGQYTGLKDKNGRMIFEGDIVIMGSLVVLVDDMRSVLSDIQYRKHYTEEKNGSPIEDFEVIGNIYDNPELFKEKSELPDQYGFVSD